jgi:hypothetical protein
MHVQTTDKTQIRSDDHAYDNTDNCQVNNKDGENDEDSPGGTHDHNHPKGHG